MSALDDYLVDPKLSLLDKTRIQAQVLVPLLSALRSELGKEKADAIVKQALRGWSKQLFAAIADGVDGSPRRNGRPYTPPWPKSPSTTLRWRCAATIRRRWNSTLRIAGSPSFSARSASPSLARYSYAKPTSTSPLRAAATSLSLVTRPSCKARRAARSATSSRHDEDAAVTRAAVSSETSAVTCRCRVRRSSSHRLRRCRRQSPPSLARAGRPHLRHPWMRSMRSGDRRRAAELPI